jgi:hypothetical protein
MKLCDLNQVLELLSSFVFNCWYFSDNFMSKVLMISLFYVYMLFFLLPVLFYIDLKEKDNIKCYYFIFLNKVEF